ncbi:MAG: ATP-dependent Clp protease proteolytic subunit [Anaeroplasma bactoclasticum]|nr:ATP-dependent Clp protease proteolytic subunit [Staphylococcus sp.]MCM1350682.1 ATP-dependent Clp protease proteolytic subunit [Prevotella sp.]MCM1514394.1 ATP-dependent Clp protease proteolytic subunit [Anaeroplasma bactoclasticum]
MARTYDEKFSPMYALDRNTVNIFGPIDTAMAEMVISQLQYLDNKFKTKDIPLEDRVITIQINSPGGSISDGLAIYDTMNYIDAKIVTVGLGLAASMGAFLLSAGTKGMRMATENCEILIHQPLGGAQGQASDIILVADHLKKTRDRLNRILSENTGQSIQTIQKDTDRDYIMTAVEAHQYGLIDKVILSKRK